MQSSLKSFLPLILLAGIGFTTLSLLYYDVSPKASVDLQLSRSEIMERSQSYLNKLGYDLEGMDQIAVFRFDGEMQLALQVRHGMRKASEIVRGDSLTVHSWQVFFIDPSLPRSQALDEFIVWVSPGGRILGFTHTIKENAPGSSLTQREAIERAMEFLREQGINLDDFTLDRSSQRRLTKRTDYDFSWTANDTTLGYDSAIALRIQGAEVGFFRQTMAVSGSLKEDMGKTQTITTFIASGSSAAIFLLFFFIVIFFLKKYHEGEVGVKTGILVFLILYSVSILGYVVEFPAIGSDVGMGDVNKANVRLIIFIFYILIIAVFVQVLVFAGWSVGESYARSGWGSKLAAIDSLIARRFFTLNVAQSVLRGYALGGILLGLFSLLVFLSLGRFDGLGLYVPSISGIPDTFVPALAAILLAIWIAAFNEIVYRLFFITYLREKMRRVWPAIILSSLLFPLTAFIMWDFPFGYTNLSLLYPIYAVTGFLFAMIFLHWDLLTAIIANFVVTAVGYAGPVFTSSGEYFQTQQLLFLGLMAIPLAVAVIGFVRQEVFEFKPETTPAHIRRITERERMAKELEIARSVQLSLLPKENPHVEGYDIAGLCIPALEVGGDYYDFVHLGNGKMGIAIGDVSGKGVPAAIYMTLTKGILQSHAEENISPREVLSKVNKLMYRTIDRHSFVSMFYAILDTRNHSIRFARAGHNPAILAGHAGGKHEFLVPAGIALGLDDGEKFNASMEEREIQLRSGDLLVFYTDGFVEAVRRDSEEFGEGRLSATIQNHRARTASEILQNIVAEVKRFVGDVPQRDDMTMVVLKVR